MQILESEIQAIEINIDSLENKKNDLVAVYKLG